MTNKTILKKIFQKAVKNGWDKSVGGVLYSDSSLENITYCELSHIIFDPKFAKAFFTHKKNVLRCHCDKDGFRWEGKYCAECGEKLYRDTMTVSNYIYHLKELIDEICDGVDPLQYLKKFI